jgi:Predicted nucleotide-binding protein containing TIR-like domain
VFIAHGKNMAIVEQVQTLLGFAEIESEVAEEEETTAIPVPDKVFNAMRRCDAGVIVVSEENGDTTVNQNVLIEIGAAFVLYERRVILVWDRRIPRTVEPPRAVPLRVRGGRAQLDCWDELDGRDPTVQAVGLPRKRPAANASRHVVRMSAIRRQPSRRCRRRTSSSEVRQTRSRSQPPIKSG